MQAKSQTCRPVRHFAAGVFRDLTEVKETMPMQERSTKVLAEMRDETGRRKTKVVAKTANPEGR